MIVEEIKQQEDEYTFNIKISEEDLCVPNISDVLNNVVNAAIQAKSTLRSISKSVAQIQPTMNSLSRNYQVLSEIQKHAVDDLVSAAAKIVSYQFDVVPPLVESLSSCIEKINWESLKKLPKEFNLESFQNGAKKWGEYGWAINDLSMLEIKNAPDTLGKADSCYLKYMTIKRMQLLFDNVSSNISRKKDFQECVELYKGKHYKPCAMMLCSLIEGQLINKMPRNSDWRNGRAALRMSADIKNNDAVSVIWAQNTLCAYDYYFQKGDNFNRSVEGELNRNFLMHGMMYKSVRRKTCMKLFLLLESVISTKL